MLMVKREIEAMDSGVIEALADSSAARENIKRLALSKGWKVEIRSQEGDYLLTLSK
jgi:TusA-related sulfurtransferase